MEELNQDERARYQRQMLLAGWGEEGQKTLKATTIGVVGAGGLGCSALLQLAAVGFGRIVVVDRDTVELSNLNRQVLHWEADLARPKVHSASEKLRRMNSKVEVEAVLTELTRENIGQILGKADALIDALDNFPDRLLINEFAVAKRIPLFHGAVWGFEGRAITVLPGKTACLRCLYGEPPRTAGMFPVVGVAPALVAAIQVTEAVKHFTGIGEMLAGELLVYDGASMRFLRARVERRPDCPTCGRV
jgi:adenylyltransferase/sulfurtransferase